PHTAGACAGGKRASIAEEERPGVFTMRVGNILPGERVTVRLTLAGELPYEDGAATFRFPLVVAPRYVPGAPLAGEQVGDGVAPDTDAVPDASRISPPVLLPGFPNPVRLSVTVDVDPAGLPLAAVASSLHTVITERRADGLRVRLEPGERADRDFLLRLAFDGGDAVSTSLAVLPDAVSDDGDGRGEGGASPGGTFALTLLPPAGAVPARDRDVVIVLDRSGSMGGWKMVAARRAAGRIVDTLRGTDRFAVLAFDNRVDTPPLLPSGLTQASDRNRFRAVEFLGGLEARGGTELLTPLRQAARLLRDEGRDRVVVLVTDGQVGNEDQLLRELAAGLAAVRVHTVGIDRAVNEAFLRRLAGPGGRCELVESEDRLDDAMRAIHRRIDTPLVTGVRLVAPAPGAGLTIDPGSLTPTPLPDLFPGAPVVITGRYTGTPTGTVTVTGDVPAAGSEDTGSGDASFEATVPATPSANRGLTALWARARIRDLEDQYVVAKAERREHDRLETTIVETSLRFGVLSRFTAFIAVDQRVVNESGAMHRVTQPVESPSGWAAPVAAAPPVMAAPAMARLAAPMKRMSVRGRPGPAGGAPPPSPAAPPPPAGPPPLAAQPEAEYSAMSAELDVPDFLKAPPPAAAPRPGGSRPGSWSGRGAGPVPRPPAGSGTTGSAPGARTLAAFVADQLALLRGAGGQDAGARAALLAELAQRILASLPEWRRGGEPRKALDALDALHRELAVPTTERTEVERRFTLAVETLESLATPDRDRSRRPFWKR
ncbi:VWA domain-containing protein, partial [Frankia nepalensis]|uniref:VWA domain-containing protein n=1 Tax=Frankia nepalensis TaxID=1836974 RepID=UPI001934930F